MMILVRILGGEVVEFDPSQSRILQECLEDVGGDEPIPIAVTSRAIDLVKKWMICDAVDPEESWSDLMLLARATDYLNMDELLDRTCRQMASMLKGKSPEEIRAMLEIS